MWSMMRRSNATQYSKLSDGEDTPDNSHAKALSDRNQSQSASIRLAFIWITQLVLLITSSALFIAGDNRILRQGPKQTQEYGRLISYTIKIHLMISNSAEAVNECGARTLHEFTGEFRAPSKWRGPPNPSVDAAWDSINHGAYFEYSASTCVDYERSSDRNVCPERRY